jgi:hypothetical protein
VQNKKLRKALQKLEKDHFKAGPRSCFFSFGSKSWLLFLCVAAERRGTTYEGEEQGPPEAHRSSKEGNLQPEEMFAYLLWAPHAHGFLVLPKDALDKLQRKSSSPSVALKVKALSGDGEAGEAGPGGDSDELAEELLGCIQREFKVRAALP